MKRTSIVFLAAFAFSCSKSNQEVPNRPILESPGSKTRGSLTSEVMVEFFKENEDLSKLKDGVWLFYSDGCIASAAQVESVVLLKAKHPEYPLGIVDITRWEKRSKVPIQKPGTPWNIAIVNGKIVDGYRGARSGPSPALPLYNQHNLSLLVLYNDFAQGDLSKVPFESDLSQEGFDSRLVEGRILKNDMTNIKAHHIKAQGTDFRGRTLFAVDFQNTDLSKSNFSNTFLSRVDFTGANLEGVNFENAVIHHITCPDGTISNSPCSTNTTSSL